MPYPSFAPILSTLEKKTFTPSTTWPKRDMREDLAVKTNIDHLLGITAPTEIRNRRDSVSDTAITSVQNVQKWRVWGVTLTSIFAALAGRQKSQSYNPLALLAVSALSWKPRKKSISLQ